MSLKEELLKRMSDGVVDMEEDEVAEAAQEFIDSGFPAFEGIMNGLIDGMNRTSVLFEEEEYFVTDVLLCSDAMYAGLNVLKPYLPEESGDNKKKAVIGVVEGDTHDIGKNLVKIMMETAGFQMIDLGRDVPLQKFVDTAKEEQADLVCLSTLMTTTMGGMKTVIELLKDAGIRDQVKVMVGGGPVSQSFAAKIGADGYSQNAVEAVRLAKDLLQTAS
ncbi:MULTISPECIES: corrinoid protein [Sellimonas]|uniref:Cobalamin-binding protein n=1 Tax=Sellimonas caecigallum TaxID=2592333 RepID=A0ABS7L4N9_9FIRM|nr:corrinoid protein [Sellimonas caecigallum]MBY0757932.1 cobalamin-binding protein [Sellimonas caecigallum]